MFERIPEQEIMEDEQATAYANADFSEPHNLYVELISKISRPGKNSSILDIGMGSADIAIRLTKKFPEIYITGFDGSKKMLEHANDKIKENGLEKNIKCKHGLIDNNILNNKKFDLVISNSVLHHVGDPKIFWDLIKNATKPGGNFFVMDLLRPDVIEDAAKIVAKYADNESEQLQMDFYNSLLAAYSVDETQQQLLESKIENFNIQQVTDRHFIVFGSMFA